MNHRLLELMSEHQLKTGERVTVTSVAEGAGVSKQTLYNWLNEGVTRFDSDTVVGLCRFFGVDLTDLLYIDWGDERPEPDTENA